MTSGIESGLPNPFPGLRSYEMEDAPWFFGRHSDIEALQRRMQDARFVAVVGASGSGKSSIVKAGLVPALRDAGGEHWTTAIFRPGLDPIGEMAMALAEQAAPEGLADERRSIETTLRRSSLGLTEVIRQHDARQRHRVLVVVDQFDEVFRFKELTRASDQGDEAVAFVNLLVESARDPSAPVCILITMRSDFLGRCEEFRGLPEVVSGGMYLIPRLTRSGLRAAIEGPLGAVGVSIAPRLVQRLLNDVDDTPDQLPVLQHALMRTWQHWRDHHAEGPLDLDSYEEIGSMRDALSRHADSVWETLRDDRQREIARAMFRRLTERGRDGNETRRPTTVGEIAAVADTGPDAVAAVVDHFREQNRALLIAPVTLDKSAVVDISHESLIRLWTRLREWMAEEALAAEEYVRIANDARLNHERRKSLYRDPELSAALLVFGGINRAWALRYHPDFDIAREFLKASRDERDRQWTAARVEDTTEEPAAAEPYAAGWEAWGHLAPRYQALADSGGPYKMLSIDGGGVRTLISLEVLAQLESMLAERYGADSRFRLCDYFDMIGGTSTGAIVAAALARGVSVGELRSVFRHMLPTMFSRRSLLSRWKSLYDGGPIGDALREFFGAETTLAPEHLRTLLLLVVKNATTESAWPITSNPWGKYSDMSRADSSLRLPLWQLLRGSTAAPTYFPPETIRWSPSDPSKAFVIADGGSTPYNHPAFLMARVATDPAYRLEWPRGESKLLIVSVGTGVSPLAGRTAEDPETNIATGAITMLNGLLSAVETDQELSCRTIGRCMFGESIDREVGDLVRRDASTDTGRSFLYVRYNAMLTRFGLEALGVLHVDPSQLRMDSIDSLDDLAEIGRAVARQVSLDHFGRFVS